jgi:hypothetical protein
MRNQTAKRSLETKSGQTNTPPPAPRTDLARRVTRLLMAVACIPTHGQTAESTAVLSTFGAGPPGLHYELSVGPCRSGKCPLQVRLQDASQVLDTMALEWPSPSRHLQREPVGIGWGVGDTLGPAPGMQAWAAAIDDPTYVSTFARTVKLTPERTGLLVTQRRGVEPVKRWHAVFLAADGHMSAPWKRREGNGPTWSATQVLHAANDREQILYVEGYAIGGEGDGDIPDRLQLKVIWWDDRRAMLVESPANEKVTLQTVWFGGYPTVAAANKARSRDDCLFRYWILDAQRYNGLPEGRYFVGTISSDPELAQQALAAAKHCPHAVPGLILPYQERNTERR